MSALVGYNIGYFYLFIYFERFGSRERGLDWIVSYGFIHWNGKGYGWTLNKAYIFCWASARGLQYKQIPLHRLISVLSVRVPGGMRVHVKELSKLLWCWRGSERTRAWLLGSCCSTPVCLCPSARSGCWPWLSAPTTGTRRTPGGTERGAEVSPAAGRTPALFTSQTTASLCERAARAWTAGRKSCCWRGTDGSCSPWAPPMSAAGSITPPTWGCGANAIGLDLIKISRTSFEKVGHWCFLSIRVQCRPDINLIFLVFAR